MKRYHRSLLTLLLLGWLTPAAAETAIFAGGCFWCTESDFEKLEGVTGVVSGYIGGTTENPTYKEVTHQNTGHYEAVKVTYDSDVISYNALLDHFWLSVDPFDPDGQFCDKGSSYRTAIFTRGESQYKLAKASRKALQASLPDGMTIVTEIIQDKPFYAAEDYHQDYYKTNPLRYKYYRWNCGRDQRLKELWGDKVPPLSKPM